MKYPRKETPTDAPIIDVIRDRWSPISFSAKPLPEETIRSLFEAARWAQSSFGEEPWRYIYAAKGDPGRENLESLLAEGNAWAKDAGLLLISFAKKTFARNGKPNRHYLHDTGAASAYITLQATSMGLITHQMAGFAVEKANALLGVPADFEPGSMMAIGEYAGQETLDDAAKKRENSPRTRKPQSAFAFRNAWKD